jgi:hypothetical protein
MKKEDFIKALNSYLESDKFRYQLDLNEAPLLPKERENLRNTQHNWQSFVISTLMRSPIITDENLFYYNWRVQGLPDAPEVANSFCKRSDWLETNRWRKQCLNEDRCWESKGCELDAVMKDKNGRWQAVFEYEDSYDDYCEVLCRTFKVMKWLENEQKIAPVLYLFYWIPSKPQRNRESSKANLLDWYVPFIKKHFYSFYGIRIVIVLQNGPDNPPYAITKTKVVTDDRDFRDLRKMLDEFP